MIKIAAHQFNAKALLPLTAALALSLGACQAEEPTYEADAEDMSGGELIVAPEDPAVAGVELPETAMTPVPMDEAPAEDMAE